MSVEIYEIVASLLELALWGSPDRSRSPWPPSEAVRLSPKAGALIGSVEVVINQADEGPGQNPLAASFSREVFKAVRQTLADVERIDVLMYPAIIRTMSGNLPVDAASTADTLLLLAVACVPFQPRRMRFEGWLRLFPRTEALQRFKPEPDDTDRLVAGNAILRAYFDLEQPIPDSPQKLDEIFVAAAQEIAEWAADKVKAF